MFKYYCYQYRINTDFLLNAVKGSWHKQATTQNESKCFENVKMYTKCNYIVYLRISRPRE